MSKGANNKYEFRHSELKQLIPKLGITGYIEHLKSEGRPAPASQTVYAYCARNDLPTKRKPYEFRDQEIRRLVPKLGMAGYVKFLAEKGRPVSESVVRRYCKANQLPVKANKAVLDVSEVRELIANYGLDGASLRLKTTSQTLRRFCTEQGLPTQMDPVLKLTIENKRLRDLAKLQEKENRKLQKRLDDQDELVERVAAESANILPPPKLIVPGHAKISKRQSHRDVILPIYDLQYGQNVRRQDTPGGMNVYNDHEFQARLARWLHKIKHSVEDKARIHKLDHMAIVQGGDMVEGDEIYPGMPWQLEFGPPEQVVRLNHIMSHALTDLIAHSRECNIKHFAIFNVPGNHGKVGGKRSGARPATYSWDWMYYKMLEVALAHQRVGVYVTEPGGQLYFDSQGHRFLAVHGDQVRGWGGIPLYGLTRFDAKQIRLHSIVYDYLLLGHHHQAALMEIGQGFHIMSGNWVGANNLTKEIGAAGVPSQWALFVSKSHGIGDHSLIQLTSQAESNAKPVIHQLTP